MSSRHPVSQPQKTNQSATIQSAIQEASRFKKTRGFIMWRTDAETAVANVPEDIGLSGGTQVREWIISTLLSRQELGGIADWASTSSRASGKRPSATSPKWAG